MKIGYACICLGVDNTSQRTCTQKYATEEKLKEIMEHNLRSLKTILEYNVQHHIFLYRISSDLIPFGSSPVNTLPWRQIYQQELVEIGNYIKTHGIRVSLHPGQYTILNAERQDVVERAIEDLRYHASILDAMELDATHKMILHIGGVYGDKTAAIERFIHVYQGLDEAIKNRLVIENDDHYYTIEDVLYISKELDIPVIFDNLHHQILPPSIDKEEIEWMDIVRHTWKEKDGVQKIHYSEQDPNKRVGGHAKRIDIDVFLAFYLRLRRDDLDIMLEVKDKNVSALKCNNLIHTSYVVWEEVWGWYRYLFYLHSPALYELWNQRFQEHQEFSLMAFYKRADTLLEIEVSNERYEVLFHFLLDSMKQQVSPQNLRLLLRAISDFQKHTKTAQSCLASIQRVAERENITDIKFGLFLLG